MNSEKIGKHVSDFIGDEKDFNVAILKMMVAYGAEIKKECCNILVETLYDMFNDK